MPENFISTFLVPHRDPGRFRLITDFRPLNSSCSELPILLDNVRHLRYLFVWHVASLGVFNIKDGYHHFRLAPHVQKLFSFHTDNEFFEVATLNFGWN